MEAYKLKKDEQAIRKAMQLYLVDVYKRQVVYRKGDVVYNAAKDLSDTTISSAQKAAYQVKDDTLVIQTAESIQVTAVNEEMCIRDSNKITGSQLWGLGFESGYRVYLYNAKRN